MTEEEEIDHIRRVRDGETAAFGALVEAWQAPLLRYLTSLLQDHHRLAEDLAQDVFIEAYRKLADFDAQRSRFSTWLFLRARSRAINALRKKRPELMAEPPEVIAADTPSEEREKLRMLDAAFHRLPPNQRRAFQLAVIEGIPHEEVAQIEGVAIGTIKSRVNRARTYLKSQIEV
ncbi:MAG: sigma-70 family RNA polymerase sigma factor [Verrucomicrobiota bacterium]